MKTILISKPAGRYGRGACSRPMVGLNGKPQKFASEAEARAKIATITTCDTYLQIPAKDRPIFQVV